MGSLYQKISTMKTRTAIIIFIVLGCAVYFNALNSQFLWDDGNTVVNNTYIKDWRYLPNFFSDNFFEGSNMTGGYWRPAFLLSLSLDYRIGGLTPAIYHLDNLIWHILAAILVYIILLKLFKNKPACFLTALIFLLHPLQIEGVTYVSGRGEPMSAALLLLSFLFFWKYANEKRRLLNFLFSVVFFALALLVHERTAVFPAIILLYIFTLYRGTYLAGWKKKLLAASPFLSIGILYAVLRLTILRFSNNFDPVISGDIGAAAFIGKFMLASLKAIAVYAGLLVFPAKLYMEKSVTLPASFFDGYVIAGIALVMASIAGFFASLKRKKIFAFGIGWFWIFLSISLYAYPAMGMLWEHWLYLPMVGLWMPLSIIAAEKIKKAGNPLIKAAIILVIIAFLAGISIRTVIRNNDWRDPITFFEKNVAIGGSSARIYNELGSAYKDTGRNDEAIATYKKSAELDNQMFQPWYNMGVIYEINGDLELAKMAYSQALARDFSSIPAYEGLAIIAIKNENIDGAIVLYKKILEIYPQDETTLLNIGACYYQQGKKEEARAYLEQAQALDPKNQDIIQALKKVDSMQTEQPKNQ